MSHAGPQKAVKRPKKKKQQPARPPNAAAAAAAAATAAAVPVAVPSQAAAAAAAATASTMAVAVKETARRAAPGVRPNTREPAPPPTASADARSAKEAQPAAPAGARINKKAGSRKHRSGNKQQASLLPSLGRIVCDYSEYRQRIDEARRAAAAALSTSKSSSSEEEPAGSSRQAPAAWAQARFALNNVAWGVARFDPEEILLLVDGFELRKNVPEAAAAAAEQQKKGARAQAQPSQALYWGVRRGEHWRIWHPYGNNPIFSSPVSFFLFFLLLFFKNKK